MNKCSKINLQDTLYGKFIDFLIKVLYIIPLPMKLKKFINYETLSYLFVGVLTTVVNYLTYFILRSFFHENVSDSTIISWIIAVTFAYFPNKIIVFGNMDFNAFRVCKEFMTFVASRLFSGFCEWSLMVIMVNFLNINDYISKIAVSVIVVIMNYITSKIVVFGKLINIKEQ